MKENNNLKRQLTVGKTAPPTSHKPIETKQVHSNVGKPNSMKPADALFPNCDSQ